MNNKDTLGDRIKRYESISEHYFTPKVPIIVRVDGKAFHTWTKGCKKPFDRVLITSMFQAAKEVADEMMNCRGVYVQSDEATFVMDDSDTIETQQWFGGRQNKIESVTAGLMTARFNFNWGFNNFVSSDSLALQNMEKEPAVFDARAFQMPKEDVANAFLWRVRDWERNSVTMYCSQFFSHKELDGKNISQRHEMLSKVGRDWNKDCTDQQRNGSWYNPVTGGTRHDLKNYGEINNFLFNKEDPWLNSEIEKEAQIK